VAQGGAWPRNGYDGSKTVYIGEFVLPFSIGFGTNFT